MTYRPPDGTLGRLDGTLGPGVDLGAGGPIVAESCSWDPLEPSFYTLDGRQRGARFSGLFEVGGDVVLG